MKRNLDTRGRILRLLIGIALLAFAWWQGSWLALGFALFTFYEALASWCVVYAIFGINHCKVDQHPPKSDNHK